MRESPARLFASPRPAGFETSRLPPDRRQGRHNGAGCRRQPHGEYQQRALPACRRW